VNRLSREKSPYLLQHAGNPVDWFPWGEEAFAEARRREAPVFLSVGYSACHWCHVMERESFEDGEVARLLNADFVAVKVDREELPAVDHLAMAYTQAMTGGGGWPTTVVATPAGLPFFAGTYFPRESGLGRPGLLELLPRIAGLWRERRAEVLATAERLLGALRERLRPRPGPVPGEGAFAAGRDALAGLYDARYGGFGGAPKFPTVSWLLFLTERARRTGDERVRAMVEETLRAMRLGGIWDHLGGGFHRYSTDREWLVPHFEKMLYDQALLAIAYAEAHAAWGEEAFRRTAEETLAYLLADLRAPDGGFAAAEDADSEGEEGRFYLWSAGEISAELGDAAGEFMTAFHARPNGNFRGETGEWSFRNILHRLSPLAVSAADFVLPGEGLPPALEASRTRLLAARARRVRPHRDDKVLADWNGLAVAALARCASAFAAPRYAGEGGRALDFVLERLRGPGGGLLHRYREGEAACPGCLDDYACLAWGALELHGATGEPRRLEQAQSLAGEMLRRFSGSGGGALLFAEEDPLLPLRQVVSTDAAVPSGNAIAAGVLAGLGRATGEPRWRDAAVEILAALGGEAAESPLGSAHLLTAAMQLEG